MSKGAKCNISRLEKDDIPTNIKHLYDICTTSTQRIRRWSNIVHMLFKYLVCTGMVYMTPWSWYNWILNGIHEFFGPKT